MTPSLIKPRRNCCVTDGNHEVNLRTASLKYGDPARFDRCEFKLRLCKVPRLRAGPMPMLESSVP